MTVAAQNRRTFDLGKVPEIGVTAIREGLSIDREHVRGFNFDEATGRLEVRLAGPAAAEHVEAFIASMKRTYKLMPSKVLRANRAKTLSTSDIDRALRESSEVRVLGEGLAGLSGSLLSLFRFFEREFRQLAREFEAEEHHYPVLIPGEILAEVGYFEHFPQHVTFCSHLPDNLPALESAVAEAKSHKGRWSEDLSAELAAPRHVLIPGVCLPCYCQFRGEVLRKGEVRTLTLQNHVFRYEGTSFRPLARAWDFTVRDIVFFGSGDDLERLRGEVMERAMDLCGELDLEVSLELAHDPFFLDASRDKAIYQRLGEVKYELLFHLPHRREPLAASSFNLHRDFYTSVYDTRRAEGDLAESACMGFGLERWLYGFLSQKGLDPRGWPRRVTSNLGAI